MRRANLGLAILVVVLGAVVYTQPTTPPQGYPLSERPAASVTSILTERGGREFARLEKQSGHWRVIAPFAARADAGRVERLLALLEARATARLPAQDIARYDLDPPGERIVLDGEAFALGAVSPVERDRYVGTADAVYTVPISLLPALPASPLDFVSRQLLGPDEVPVEFELPGWRLAQAEGRWSAAPSAADASQDDYHHWADAWRSAQALSVVAAPAGKPLAQVRIVLKNGQGVVFDVMQREPGTVLVRRGEPLGYELSTETARRLLAPPALAK